MQGHYRTGSAAKRRKSGRTMHVSFESFSLCLGLSGHLAAQPACCSEKDHRQRTKTEHNTEHRKSLFFFFFPAAPGPDTPLRTGSTHTPAAQSAHARRACALDDDPSYFVLRLVDDHLSGGSLPTALALDLTGSPSAQLRWIRSCYFS